MVCSVKTANQSHKFIYSMCSCIIVSLRYTFYRTCSDGKQNMRIKHNRACFSDLKTWCLSTFDVFNLSQIETSVGFFSVLFYEVLHAASMQQGYFLVLSFTSYDHSSSSLESQRYLFCSSMQYWSIQWVTQNSMTTRVINSLIPLGKCVLSTHPYQS